ncbi:Sugar transferase involved in LPS biosynthesis (colanic, teichoic acid) [Lachnospiraceae bacterium RM5]|nr:Sugar transferase involved in LPS biosynthesis (colanic, teichoic acid) [Lachnospiraceae bacterium RM5]
MYRKYIKRFLDIVLSGIAILILSPIMLITAFLVRVKLGRPIIFTQDRPGKNEKIFRLYKFRTMSDERDEKGKLLPDQQRLLRFGRILRSTSLDELPELVNIFKGDMSIVGPRPLLVRYLPYYKPEEKIRHSVRPGLTGLAQVNGRNNLDWDSRIGLDVEYVKRISLAEDLRIIVETVLKVIKRSDIASGDQLAIRDLDIERKNQLED